MERYPASFQPRLSSINVNIAGSRSLPASPDMYHRPNPNVIRPAPTPSPVPSLSESARVSSSGNAPPPMSLNGSMPIVNVVPPTAPLPREEAPIPTIFGLPLKYVSLVTLAVQNAALSIVMHYSRVSMPPSESYSPATAVLLNEILKGTISFVTALWRISRQNEQKPFSRAASSPLRQLLGEVFSPDCWKLSIPAFLYVVQNSLQFVAISNLPVATFQVTYQMKILTTAAFSVVLLRRRLSPTKWIALLFLAIGVAIVQLQTSSTSSPPPHSQTVAVGSAHDNAPYYMHVMSPLKGFGAVTAACFTSGLAGVYFEMVLKGSKADLWVRNVQLSLFSLPPALLPVIFHNDGRTAAQGFLHNFGAWAWATVAIQVFGGLVTAIVIKYSDNILKGFATSLSIVLSFLASVLLFHFRITPTFVLGASTVLAATWMYNQPAGREPAIITSVVNNATGSKTPTTWPGSPVDHDAPILGQFDRKSSGSPRAVASALYPDGPFSETADTPRYLAEDPDVVARRDEIMARQETLEKVKAELYSFGI
ncbi:hypothetical protein EWM64_g7081 [Hericium alpestre]|uniref:UDP-galactose transporter n=1 Tax=Hericium alpestre TaxID=135208 RepID=A0A4Y9ZSY5_9AGAM|nr:hypothetical protein EWM64_g7081 [Hericium alpestre]